MAYKYRMILSFLLAGLCLYLVATVLPRVSGKDHCFLHFLLQPDIWLCYALQVETNGS